MTTRYPSEPGNLTAADVVRSPLFTPAVLSAVQSASLRGYLVDRSVPQRAVDTPVGTSLPQAPQDKDEFFLIVDSAAGVVRHLRYRKAVARWEFVGGWPDEVTSLPSDPSTGDIVVYVTDASYDSDSLLRWNGTEWHQLGVPPYVTALPTPPFDGFEVYYAADATNGVIWHLRYRSGGGTYKWEYVGGPPLWAEVTTQQTTSSTSYTDLATSGPAVTLPLAGDYDVTIGMSGWSNTNGGIAYMSYAIGATAASDNDSVRHQEPAGSNTGPTHVVRTRRKTGLTAVALTAKYKTGGAGTATIETRYMVVTPVRVG